MFLQVDLKFAGFMQVNDKISTEECVIMVSSNRWRKGSDTKLEIHINSV